MKAQLGMSMLAALFVGGCVTTGSVGSVKGGECRLVNVPQYAVLGKTDYDQSWINTTTEAIIAGCKQKRPVARPATLDEVKAAIAAAPPKQKSRLRRFFGV